MSVPVNQRSHGKLEAYSKSYELVKYTLQITKNKRQLVSAIKKYGCLLSIFMEVREMTLLKRRKLDLQDMAALENANADAIKNAEGIEDDTTALVELAELIAEQEEALVELAELIGG